MEVYSQTASQQHCLNRQHASRGHIGTCGGTQSTIINSLLILCINKLFIIMVD